MTTEKLDIMKVIRDGIRCGLKNFFPLFLMVILYILTFWIPYLNVGTTIGFCKAVISVGRGEKIDPLSIFSRDNFKNLGNFFLLMGLISIGVTAAMIFMFFPAMVIGIAWSFAIYFLIDKQVSPLKALQLSYDATYGNKWRIFFVGLLCGIVVCVISLVLGLIPKVGPVLAVIGCFLFTAIIIAVEGVMYDFFSQKADAIIAEHRAQFCRHHAPEAPAAEAPVAEAPAADDPAPEA